MIHAVCFPIDHPFHSWPVFHLLEFLSIIIPIRSWSLFLRVYLLHPFCSSGNSVFLSSLPYFVSACTPVHNLHISGYKHVIGLTFDTSSPSSLSSITNTILPLVKGRVDFHLLFVDVLIFTYTVRNMIIPPLISLKPIFS